MTKVYEFTLVFYKNTSFYSMKEDIDNAVRMYVDTFGVEENLFPKISKIVLKSDHKIYYIDVYEDGIEDLGVFRL